MESILHKNGKREEQALEEVLSRIVVPAKCRKSTTRCSERGLDILTPLRTQGKKESSTRLEKRNNCTDTKKSDRQDCKNYRGIALLSKASKPYEIVVKRGLVTLAGEHLDLSQSVFSKSRSIRDHICTIK